MVMSLLEDQAGRENFNPVSERTLDKLQTSARLDSAGRAERQDVESASDLKTNRETRCGPRLGWPNRQTTKMNTARRDGKRASQSNVTRTCERARELKALANELYKGTREYRRSVSEMYKETRKLKG